MMTETEDNSDDYDHDDESKYPETSEGNGPSTPPRLHTKAQFGTPNTVVSGEQDDEENMPLLKKDTDKTFLSNLNKENFSAKQDLKKSGKRRFEKWSIFKNFREHYNMTQGGNILPCDTYSFFVFAYYKFFARPVDAKKEVNILSLRIPKPKVHSRQTLWRFVKKEGGDFYKFPCCYPVCLNSVFWVALIVFTFQVGILIMMLHDHNLRYWDVVDSTPGSIGITVRICQFCALLISVVQQEEFLQAINAVSLIWKHREKTFNVSGDIKPLKLLFKPLYENYIWSQPDEQRYNLIVGWWFAIAFRAILGIFVLYTTFVLVVTEGSVRDIVLNFSAIQIISTVDDSMFKLASDGYFGKELEDLAGLIEDTQIDLAELENAESPEDPCSTSCVVIENLQSTKCSDPEESSSTEGCKSCFRRLFCTKLGILVLHFLILFVMWLIVVIKQERGDNFCQTLFVQFGDENSPELAPFSGYYDLKMERIINRKRVAYRAQYWAMQKWNENDRIAKFGYSKKQNGAWGFAYSNKSLDNTPHKEINWVVRAMDDSETTNILDVAESEWISSIDTNIKDSNLLPLQYLRMECVCADEKCGKEKNCKKNHHCFNGGTCNKDGTCKCANGWWGPQCKLRYPCDTLEIDPQFGEFSGDQIWSKRYFNVFDEPLAYKSIEKTSVNSTVYGRPVFVGNRTDKGNVDLIFFTGRRWVLTSTELLEDFNTSKPYNNTDPNAKLRSNIKDIKGLKMSNTTETIFQYAANYLVNDFHAHFSNYKAYFVSQSMDITSINNAASPENLQWYHAKRVMYEGKTVVQPDSNRPSKAVLLCATCNKDTNPCFYDNTCNDDGKCNCTNTGSSGALCQIAPSDNGVCDMYFNKHEFAYDGGDCCEATCVQPNCPKKGGINYRNCTDPDWACEDPAVTCFKENFNEIFGECANGENGRAVALSDNSKDSLYLAIGEPGCDGVRVYDTTTREQRGQWIKGPRNSSFGDSVALSDDADVLAIGAPGDHGGNGTVWIYYWFENHKEWFVGFQGTGEESDSRLGESLDLSDSGDKLVVATSMKIIIWTKDGTNNNWTPTKGSFTLEGTAQEGKALSISSDAQFIAVATTLNGTNSTRIYREDNGTYSKYGQTLNDRMSVVISGNARVLVASNSNQTFAYYRNESSRRWDTIDVNDAESIKKTAPVALSKEGNTLVVDTDSDDDAKNFLVYLLQVPNTTDTGETRALAKDNSSISYKFEALNADDAIPSGQGRYAALSYIETGEIVIAVGDPLANTTGKTSMYSPQAGSKAEIEQRQLCKGQGKAVSLEVTITTDDHPEKINWALTDTENTQVWAAGSYKIKNNPEKETKRLCRETSRQLRLVEDDRKMLAKSNCDENCWTFTINHAPSNESKSVGMYEVKWNESVAANGKFSNSTYDTRCICDPSIPPTQPPPPTPSTQPTTSRAPSMQPTQSFPPTPSTQPTTSSAPSMPPTQPPPPTPSTQPTTSRAPSMQPTQSFPPTPSTQPTTSSAPSMPPTQSFPPTPSTQPTTSPAPSIPPTQSSPPTLSTQPSSPPTLSTQPTTSSVPSIPPTQSAPPTLSTQPTTSRAPSIPPTQSAPPTLSTQPTISSAPSMPPTQSFSPTPSTQPPTSPAPSMPPTQPPSPTPSTQPPTSPAPSMPPTQPPTPTPGTQPPTSSAPSMPPTQLPTPKPTNSPCMQRQDSVPPSVLMLDNEILPSGNCFKVHVDSTFVVLSLESNGRLVLKNHANDLIWESTSILCGSEDNNNVQYYTDLQRDGNWITRKENTLDCPTKESSRGKDSCKVWKSLEGPSAGNSDIHYVRFNNHDQTISIVKGDPGLGGDEVWNSAKDNYYINTTNLKTCT